MSKALRIPWAKPELWGNEKEYVERAIDTTWISGGEFVDRFESGFKSLADTRFALSTSNGTTAIHLAFLAFDVGPGDEVIVPGFGFLAAAHIAMQMGAKPIFAEVDPETWCLGRAGVEACLTPQTKMVVPVHTYGNVCEMESIVALAKENGIRIVEDAAEAFLSRYDNRLAGTMSDIGCFSFQATKTLTTGEGGMVVTQNADIFNRMELYRNHGMRIRRYWHEVPGHNFRLTNFQAAMGCAQMEMIDAIVRERKRIYTNYFEYLSRIDGITLQHFNAKVDPVLWSMAIKLDPLAFPQGREGVMAQMLEQKIETRPGFYAASRMDIYPVQRLPVSEEISEQVISLPTFPSLTNEQIDTICGALEKTKR